MTGHVVCSHKTGGAKVRRREGSRETRDKLIKNILLGPCPVNGLNQRLVTTQTCGQRRRKSMLLRGASLRRLRQVECCLEKHPRRRQSSYKVGPRQATATTITEEYIPISAPDNGRGLAMQKAHSLHEHRYGTRLLPFFCLRSSDRCRCMEIADVDEHYKCKLDMTTDIQGAMISSPAGKHSWLRIMLSRVPLADESCFLGPPSGPRCWRALRKQRQRTCLPEL